MLCPLILPSYPWIALRLASCTWCKLFSLLKFWTLYGPFGLRILTPYVSRRSNLLTARLLAPAALWWSTGLLSTKRRFSLMHQKFGQEYGCTNSKKTKCFEVSGVTISTISSSQHLGLFKSCRLRLQQSFDSILGLWRSEIKLNRIISSQGPFFDMWGRWK